MHAYGNASKSDWHLREPYQAYTFADLSHVRPMLHTVAQVGLHICRQCWQCSLFKYTSLAVSTPCPCLCQRVIHSSMQLFTLL